MEAITETSHGESYWSSQKTPNLITTYVNEANPNDSRLHCSLARYASQRITHGNWLIAAFVSTLCSVSAALRLIMSGDSLLLRNPPHCFPRPLKLSLQPPFHTRKPQQPMWSFSACGKQHSSHLQPASYSRMQRQNRDKKNSACCL